MKFDLKHLVFTILACSLITVPMVGCGSGEPKAVTDDADSEALAEFDRLEAESEAAEEAENEGADE